MNTFSNEKILKKYRENIIILDFLNIKIKERGEFIKGIKRTHPAAVVDSNTYDQTTQTLHVYKTSLTKEQVLYRIELQKRGLKIQDFGEIK